MKVTTAMLADAATVADGKLYVHGGGWDVINAVAIPTTHPLIAIALVLEVEWSETHVDRSLHVSLHDEDDNPMNVGAMGTFNIGHPAGAAPGSPIIQPLALQFPGVTFPRAGRYFFRISVDEQELARVPFAIRTPPPVPQVPGGPSAIPPIH